MVNEILKPKNILDIVNKEFEVREASSTVIDDESFMELIEIIKGKEIEFYKHPQGLVFEETNNNYTNFDFHQRKSLKRRKFYGRELTGDGSFYDYDTLDFERSVRIDNENFLNKEHESFAELSAKNNLSLKEQEEGHLLIDLDFELFIIENKIKFLSEIDAHFKWAYKLVNSLYETIYKFCEINGVDEEVEEMLLKIADTHSWMGSLFFNRTLEYIVSQSDYLTVLESEKEWYYKETGHIARADYFASFLARRFETVLGLFIFDDIKLYLAEFVYREVSKNEEYYQKAKQLYIIANEHQ